MEALLDVVQQILIVLAVVAVGSVAALLYKYVRMYLEANLDKDTFTLIQDITNMVVRYLEQQGELFGLSGEQKKEQALAWVSNLLDDYGIDVSYETIDMAIEAAVQAMNALLNEPE